MYQTLIYQPLLNALVFFYNTIAGQDLGLAIIFLTILIRIVLFPIFQQSSKYQMVMQAIQPKLKDIQETLKHDKVKQTEELMALYKTYGLSPFSMMLSFLFLFLQLPIFFALYKIVSLAITPEGFQGLYSFVAQPGPLHTTFLGLLDLKSRSIIIVVLASAAQLVQGKLMFLSRKGKAMTPAEKMSQRMVYLAPALTLFIFFNFPAALGLYWFTAGLFSIGQQLLINKQLLKHDRILGSISQKTS